MTAPSAPRPPRAQPTLVHLLRHRAEATPDQVSHVFLADGERPLASRTYAELERRARAMARTLASVASRGDRVLLLHPAGLDVLDAFFGVLAAGVIGVPAPAPGPGRSSRALGRLLGIVADAAPVAVLTTAKVLARARPLIAATPVLASLPWIATDEIPDSAADGPAPALPDTAEVAYLQYTSGSTGQPKGVVVTHACLDANLTDLDKGWDHHPGDVLVSWLPFFHDLGLVYGALEPLFAGIRGVMMAPAAFAQQPARWLRALSEHGGTHSAAPDFAYDLCVQTVSAEERAGLDLRRWRVAINAAEPVRSTTIERFAAAFASTGFRREALAPAYGLAEATLRVTYQTPGVLFETVALDADALALDRIVPVAHGTPGARVLVSSGQPGTSVRVEVADPTTLHPLGEREVGEVMVAGPALAAGYWKRADATEEIFGARLAGSSDRWLRTGDLGFFHEGALFIAGRRKDLVIVEGRNHYPQDVEATVLGAHPALGPHAAAFGFDGPRGERLGVAVEIDRDAGAVFDELFASVREAVAEVHDVAVEAIVLVRARTLPRTSSGKLQRRACRAGLTDGSLAEIARWTLPEPGSVAAAEPAPARSRREIEDFLRNALAARLGVPANAIDAKETFVRFGLGSSDAVGLSGRLAIWLGRELPASLLWDQPSVAAVARFLAGEETAALAAPRAAASDAPIAIVGLACRFPGGASDMESYWRLLADGRDVVTEVPRSRWSLGDWYDPDPNVPGRIASRHGAFLDGVDLFDAWFFGISAREAAAMDPQQRLLLELAQEAFDDAGLPRRALAGSRTGVFVGVAQTEYAWLSVLDPAGVSAHTASGVYPALVANRVSYHYDLRGPSFGLDSVCSSSLVALHLACQSLRTGESDAAVAGGVVLLLNPDEVLWFSKLGVLSPGGRCRAFDAAGDGIVLGEGAAVAVLKRLDDAVRDGDRVYAVIRGSAVGQDGRSNGITAPRQETQEGMIREACARAGIIPSDVGLVDAHGTGTVVGDPIEARALGAVYGEGRAEDRPLLVGSVKTNLGHLSMVGGLASLMKVVLALRHRAVPPSLHFETPNPGIDFAGLRLRVPKALEPWPEGKRPATAAATSLSFGGTNAHVIVEEPPALAPMASDSGPWLLMLTARTPGALRSTIERYASFQPEGGDWVSAAFTAASRRTHYEERLGVVFRDGQDLRERLKAVADGTPARGSVRGTVTPAGAPRVIFVFPGQGGQWPGMARELALARPAFRDALRAAAAAVSAAGGPDVLAEIQAPTARFEDVDVAQPVLFAVQAALAGEWRDYGVTPDAAVGHSLGEMAAAWAAGALSLEDAARVVVTRSALLARTRGQAGMAVIELDADEAAARLASGLYVAAVNGPRSTVVAGTVDALDALVAELTAEGRYAKRVRVDVATHGPGVVPLLPELRERLEGLLPRAASIPLWSTVTGERASGSELGPDYWAANLRRPVLFLPVVQALLREGPAVFVEVGPHPVLVPAVDALATAAGGAVVGSTRRDEDEHEAMLESVAALWARGVAVDASRFFRGPRRVVSLPHYPFERERHWLSTTAGGRGARRGTADGVLGQALELPWATNARAWERDLAPADFAVAHRHRLGGALLVTSSMVAELALAAGEQVCGPRASVEDLEIVAPLLVPEGETRRVQLAAETADKTTFRLFARLSDGTWKLHARGVLRAAVAPAPGAVPVETGDAEHLGPVDAVALAGRLAEAGIELPRRSWHLRDVRALPGHARGTVHIDSSVSPTAGLVDAALLVLVAGSSLFRGDEPTVLSRIDALRVSPLDGPADVTIEARRGLADARGETWDVRVTAGIVEVLAAAGVRLDRYADDSPVPPEVFDVAWVEPARASDGGPARTWSVAALRPEAAEALAGALRSSGTDAIAAPCGEGPGRGVLFLAEVEEGDPIGSAVSAAAMAVLEGARAHLRRGDEQPFLLVTRGAAAIGGTAGVPAAAALAAFGRVLFEEHHELHGTVVDLDPGPSLAALAPGLARALVALPAEPTIALRGTPFAMRLRRRASDAGDGLPRGGAWLVTGGFGGLGLSAATWLAERGVREIVLAGRRGLAAGNDLAAHAVAAIRAAGARVESVVLDVGDADAIRTFLSARRAKGATPLCGVLHAAGVTDDRPALELDAEGLSRVLRPKAAALGLVAALANEPVEAVVLLSSLGALVGLPGQAAYAAGNALLDVAAALGRRHGRRVLSLNLGPVTEGGLGATGGGRRIAAHLQGLGIHAFGAARAWDLLPALLAAGVSQAALLRVRPAVAGPRPAVFADLAVTGDGGAASFLVALRAAPVGDRPARIREHLRSQIAAVLRVAPDRLDPHRPLGAFGMDSLFAIELRNRLEASLGLTLSATLVWNHPTIAALATYFLARQDLAATSAPVAVGPPAAPVLEPPGTDRLRALSEADALRALTRRP
jgi:acyl transferase domain-containing protein/acyl-CoA synthetase (AMP-forming)/AMP-acid ligase II/acyl carrier protein/NAD(P)-dependent dehydrogenase (short-subunit alcohol dehydrogenase family)